MPDSKRSLKLTLIIMWCSFLITLPTWAYWLINLFGQTSFDNMLVESGFPQNIRLFTLISVLLPILGLVLAIYARVIISTQNQKYDLYPSRNKHLSYNNILVGYFVVLGLIGIIFLMRN